MSTDRPITALGEALLEQRCRCLLGSGRSCTLQGDGQNCIEFYRLVDRSLVSAVLAPAAGVEAAAPVVLAIE